MADGGVFMRISTVVAQLAEIDDIISAHDCTARITSPKLAERYRLAMKAAGGAGNVKKGAGFTVRKNMTIAVTLVIPEDHSEGGSAIAALERECVAGTSAEENPAMQTRTCVVDFTLPPAYLADIKSKGDDSSDVCRAICTSSSFESDAACDTFNQVCMLSLDFLLSGFDE